MIGRLIAALAAAVLVLTGCGSSNSGPSRAHRCGQSTNGVLCVVVYAGHSRIYDVIGYYSPTSRLTGEDVAVQSARLRLRPGDFDVPAGSAVPGDRAAHSATKGRHVRRAVL